MEPELKPEPPKVPNSIVLIAELLDHKAAIAVIRAAVELASCATNPEIGLLVDAI